MFLKTPFHFILQCISVPIAEQLHSQEADIFINLIIMQAHIKLFGLLDCFHYILNPPRRVGNGTIICFLKEHKFEHLFKCSLEAFLETLPMSA